MTGDDPRPADQEPTPDEEGVPDEEPTPDEGPAPDEKPEPEAGLVVEDDEIDLDEDEDGEDEPLDDDAEVDPAESVTEDEAADEPVDEDEAADEPVDEDEVADEPVDEGEVADEPVDEDDHGQEPDEPVDDAPAAAPAAAIAVAEPDASPEEDAPRRRRGRRVLLGAAAVLGAVYVAGWWLTGTRMPANATIGGVDVSGQSPAAAREAVDAALSPREDRAITLLSGSKQFTVEPGDVGLALDVEGSVERAGGRRSWDPRDMVALFVGTHDTAPAVDVDDAALQSALTTIGKSVNREVVEALITFPEGKPVAREPKAGRVLSRSATVDAIRAAYLVDDDPVELPLVDVEPTVDQDGLDEAVRTIARPAVSGPVTLRVGDKRVELPVTAFAPALSVRVVEGRLAPRLDPERLARPLTSSTTGIGKKAVDATVRIRGGKPVVVPGKEGVGLQPEEMAVKLLPALTETGDDRVVEVEAKVVEPRFTTRDAKALRITERISSFETQFPYAEYRNTNQGRAAELIDGTIIKPGRTFSFNDIVGERTAANGFVTGTVINGGVFREELGGGVSQVATTTYNAAFFGGMDDVEHHPHAFYIDRYPVGREATVYFGSLDLRWRNPTKYGVLVRAYVRRSTPSSPGEMHVELWSTKVWDRIDAGRSARRNARTPGTQYDPTDRCVPQGPVAGFDIDIYRTFVRDGREVKTETDTATYQAADRVVCGPKPDDD